MKVEYVPPSNEVIEHFARTACQELGHNDPTIVRGFSDFMKTIGHICANNLNRKAASEFDNRIE